MIARMNWERRQQELGLCNVPKGSYYDRDTDSGELSPADPACGSHRNWSEEHAERATRSETNR